MVVLRGGRSYKSGVMVLRRLGALLLPLVATLGVATVSMVFEPSAAAQGAGTPKKEDPKKPDAKKSATTPAPATTATTTPPPATTGKPEEAGPKPAEEAGTYEPDGHRAIYISGDIGFTRPDIGGISDNTGFDKTAANGFLAGLGIGYRMRELRIGARFRDSSTTQFSLWSLMGELGYGLPFRPLSPILLVHAGYMFDVGVERSAIASSLPKGNVLTPNVDLDGLVIGGELQAAYWLSKVLRIGPFIGVDFTFLHRAQAAPPQSIVPLTPETLNNKLFGESGNGLGYVLTIGLRGTADISF